MGPCERLRLTEDNSLPADEFLAELREALLQQYAKQAGTGPWGPRRIICVGRHIVRRRRPKLLAVTVAVATSVAGCGASATKSLPSSAVIGRGATLAGTSFRATAYRGEQPPQRSAGGVRWQSAPAWLVDAARSAQRARGDACRMSVSIETRGTSSESTTCMTQSGAGPSPSVTCSEGLLTVTSVTLPATRSVRLVLSDGRSVTSRALDAPADFGAHAGLYYQVVRGPSPIPRSLAELDAHGRVLRSVALPPLVECTKDALKYLPGGVRTLVEGRIPRGPAFSIGVERYRFLGKTYVDLSAAIRARGTREGGGSGGGGSSFSPRRSRQAFAWSTQEGCEADSSVRWSIVYGLLRDSRDTVLVRTGGTAYAINVASIPGSFHVGGELAYAVLPRQPSEVLVRGVGGHTVQRERLGGWPSRGCEPGESASLVTVGS
jgi:hypothetical protein